MVAYIPYIHRYSHLDVVDVESTNIFLASKTSHVRLFPVDFASLPSLTTTGGRYCCFCQPLLEAFGDNLEPTLVSLFSGIEVAWRTLTDRRQSGHEIPSSRLVLSAYCPSIPLAASPSTHSLHTLCPHCRTYVFVNIAGIVVV